MTVWHKGFDIPEPARKAKPLWAGERVRIADYVVNHGSRIWPGREGTVKYFGFYEDHHYVQIDFSGETLNITRRCLRTIPEATADKLAGIEEYIDLGGAY